MKFARFKPKDDNIDQKQLQAIFQAKFRRVHARSASAVGRVNEEKYTEFVAAKAMH